MEENRRFVLDTELERCSKEAGSWRKVIVEAMAQKRSEGTLKKKKKKEKEKEKRRRRKEEEENLGVKNGPLLRTL